jgi:GNAT superfamily N-acetyltransferase
MKSEYREFHESMIPEAAALLAARHKANRKELTLLPLRFQDPLIAQQAIRSLWSSKTRTGLAAFCDGKMSAFLLGEMAIQPWGRCGYIYLPGYALAEDENPNTIQDLYSLLGERWVRQGVFSHSIYVSAADRHVIGSFFNLGFGKERVDALLDLAELQIPEVRQPENISVRQAGAGDNENLANLSDTIFRALAEAPYWHPTVPETWAEMREGWSELADDKEWTVWMALENGVAIGMVGFRPEWEEDTQMLASAQTVYLSVAATKPEARGRGISTYLSWNGLSQARQNGFRVCYTNWISSNLLAARHWPRYGFKEAAYRLTKRISPDIAWTRENG